MTTNFHVNGVFLLQLKVMSFEKQMKKQKENESYSKFFTNKTVTCRIWLLKLIFIFLERNFSVCSVLNLDAPYMRQPASSREEAVVTGCCCKRKLGVVSAQMTVADMGLLPGSKHLTIKTVYCKLFFF